MNESRWLWGGGVGGSGYGMADGVSVHRHMLLIETGFPATSKDFACHTCDVPLCVNPSDLYWGDAKSNAADRNTRHGHPNSLKAECSKGHKLTDGNLVSWKLKKGVRECLRCSRDHKHAWKLRNK